MRDAQTWTATLLGALIGAALGYLFFTEGGRGLRHSLEPRVDDFSREVKSFRRTVEKAASVASDGYQLLNEAMGQHRFRG